MSHNTDGLGAVYSDATDIADRVGCYKNGKAFECDCGQGFGTLHECKSVTCPTCGETLIDSEWQDREPPVTDDGQATLGGWT